MSNHRATILVEDKVIARNLPAWIEVTGQPHGVKDWHGSFDLQNEAGDGLMGGMDNVYHIVLDDGREGDFLIERMHIGSHSSTNVQFQGTGPLEVK